MISNSTLPSDPVERNVLLPPGPNNPRNSEGAFIQLADGRIQFIYTHYYGDSGADHGSAFLAARFSSDLGRTWSEKDVTVVANEGKVNVMSVSLLRLAGGEIGLFYMRKNARLTDTVLMRKSHDEGRTWSDPKDCITDDPGYYILNNDRVIQLADGRLVMPVAQHRGAKDPPDTFNPAQAMCYLSDDVGRTWRRSRSVLRIPPPDVGAGLQEPGAVELAGGRLMMFCRTTFGAQYISYSQDRGETWSPPIAGPIPSPLSPASIKRIPSTGDLLLVWNNNSENRSIRTPFNCAISRDEGQSWQNIKTLDDDPNGWYCYTAIEFVQGHVLLGHCAGRRGKNTQLATTRITRLPVAWLYE